MKKIVIATRNQHKLNEIKEFFKDVSIQFLGLNEFPDAPLVEESGETLLENSLLKAKTIHRFTGYPVMADDTGLEVDFLEGAPGVKSARFAGESANSADNVKLLLKKLKNVPDAQRTARFKTIVSFASDGIEEHVEGIVEGVIIKQAVGDSGFGYDPIFYYPPLKRTFAELTLDEKNKISHRGLALEKFRILLGKIYLDE